jgi:hypothetical protein
MFGEDGNSSSRSSNEEQDEQTHSYVDKVATNNKYIELKKDYIACKTKAKNEYDFFNLIERCILGMDEDENNTPNTNKSISDAEFTENGLERADMRKLT